MSSNKKKKLDFSTALKAEADKMAPKKEAAGNPDERLVATINGVKTTFLRGNSTDAEWEAQKKMAMVEADTEPASPAAVDAAELDEEGSGKKKPKKAAAVEAPPEDSTTKSLLNASKQMPGLMADIATGPVRQSADFIDRKIIGPEPIIPGGMSALAGRVAGGVGSGMMSAGDALNMPNLAQKGFDVQQSGYKQAWEATNPAAPGAAPVGGLPMDPQAAAMPPQAPMPAAPSGPNIASGFKVYEPDPKLEAEAQKARDKAALDLEAAQTTIANEHELQKDYIANATKEQILVAQKANDLAMLASEQKRNSVTEARRYQEAADAMSERAIAAASDPTDPNRYWNNKDAGQKAMAVVAGALFGWTGQGMQWLQRLDSLVAEDMRQQEADRASKVGGLERGAARLGAAGQQALQLGATEAEAHLLERTSRLEGLKSFLDTTALQMQGSEQGVRAAMMSGQVGQNIAALKEQGAAVAQDVANRKTDISYKQAQMRQEADIARARLASDKGGEHTKMPPAQQGIIQAADAGIEALPALEAAIGNPKDSVATAAWEEMAKRFPGTDANNRDVSAKVLNRIIFAGIDKSVINAADQKFLDELQAGVGISSLRKPGAIATLRRLLNASRNSAIKNARALGQETGPLQENSGQAPKLKTERPVEIE